MVTIPEIRAKGGERVFLGAVSASAPVASDDSARFKQKRVQHLDSIFQHAGAHYEKRQENIKRAQEMTARASENIAAAKFGQGIMQQAADLPVDQRQIFIEDSMQQYNADVLGKYEDNPILQAQIQDSLQRRTFTMQDKAFRESERMAFNEAQASLASNIEILQNDIITAGSEAERIGLYQQLDDSISTSKDMGFITPVSAEQMRRSVRSQSVGAIVGRHITSGQLSKAAAYMTANEEFLTPTQLVNLDRQIKVATERVQKRAATARQRAVVRQSKLDNIERTDPGLYAVEVLGVKPNDPAGISRATGGRSVMPRAVAKQFIGQLSEMPATDAIAALNHYKNVDSDAFVADMSQAGADADVARLIEISSSSNPDLSLFRAHQKAMQMKDAQIADESGITMTKARDAVGGNEDYQTIDSYHRSMGLDIQQRNEYREMMARGAQVYAAEKGIEFNEALDNVITLPDRKFVNKDDMTYAIPQHMSSREFRSSVDKFVGSLKPSDLFTAGVDIGDLGEAVKQGKIVMRPASDPRHDRLVLSTDSGIPLRLKMDDGSPGRPISVTYDELITMGEISDKISSPNAGRRKRRNRRNRKKEE